MLEYFFQNIVFDSYFGAKCTNGLMPFREKYKLKENLNLCGVGMTGKMTNKSSNTT